MAALTSRIATPDDIETQRPVMDADGTYFVIEAEGQVAGCGGWSRRATHYGGDPTPGRDAPRGGVPAPLVRMGKEL